ncbi:MAG: CHAD domain-containing protein [Paracoccaceae bacterium]
MTEVELKFLLRPDDGEGTATLRRRLGALADGGARSAKLRTIYLDTPGGALAAAGIALRLRSARGRWTQTVKAGRAMQGGLSRAEEYDAPAPGGRLDLDAFANGLGERVRRVANGDALAPVFETAITRSTWAVPFGAARIEVAHDRGEVIAGERAEAIEELELELIDGPPEALYGLARKLFAHGPVRFSETNKAERGRRLAAGHPAVRAVAPRKAEAPALDPDGTAEAAAGAILTECWHQIAANAVAVAATEDIEGAHQLRVGLRRLRSAMKLLRPVMDGPAHRALAEEAKWLGREVGRLRDLEVAIAEMVVPAAGAAPQEPGFAPLAEALAARAAAERERLRATLAGERATGFLFDLAAYVSLRGWLDPADHAQTGRLATPFARLAADACAEADRRAAKRGRRIEVLDAEARHDLRKRLKELRYVVEYAEPALPAKKTAKLAGRLKKLQKVFGEMNDAAAAEALFLASDAPAADDPVAMRAAGRLIGTRLTAAERAWEEAVARWHAFAKTPRPWG